MTTKATQNLPERVTSSPHHELLTRKEAAHILRLQPNTLAVWASNKRYLKELPVIRLGRNSVRYRRIDVERFIDLMAGLLTPGHR